jgi:carboxypeptidase C (cathepsin A)
LTTSNGTSQAGHWDWDAKNSYADTSDNLRNTFAENPYMKLFVASGCFDLATPHFATEYTLAHLGLTPALLKSITTRRYRSGHMMYLEIEALAQLKRDVAEFIAGALKEQARQGWDQDLMSAISLSATPVTANIPDDASDA